MIVRTLCEVGIYPGGGGWEDREKFQTPSINNLSSTPLTVFILISTIFKRIPYLKLPLLLDKL